MPKNMGKESTLTRIGLVLIFWDHGQSYLWSHPLKSAPLDSLNIFLRAIYKEK